MNENVFNLPAQIDSELEEFDCDLFKLRLITNDDYKFCGVKDVQKKNIDDVGFNFVPTNTGFINQLSYSIITKTHVFEFQTLETLDDFDTSFRLFNPNHYSMKHYYFKKTLGPNQGNGFGSLRLKSPNGYFFSSRHLSKDDLLAYLDFKRKLDARSDERKITLMVNRWNFSISGQDLPLEIRLVDLLGLLEMIYVQNRERLIEALNGDFFETTLKELGFAEYSFKISFERLYKIRNAIMHGRVWEDVTRDDIIWVAKFAHASLINSIVK